MQHRVSDCGQEPVRASSLLLESFTPALFDMFLQKLPCVELALACCLLFFKWNRAHSLQCIHQLLFQLQPLFATVLPTHLARVYRGHVAGENWEVDQLKA